MERHERAHHLPRPTFAESTACRSQRGWSNRIKAEGGHDRGRISVNRDRASVAEQMYLHLVSAYQSAILNYIYRLVGDADVAEDLTQDTYIKAWRALDRLDLDAGAEPRRRAWLYRIAHNTATDHLRRRGRFRWLSLDTWRGLGVGSTDDIADVDAADAGRFHGGDDEAVHELDRVSGLAMEDPGTLPARSDAVRQALAMLSAEQRQVLLLFSHVGLSADEVAEVLGIQPAAARKRRQRAREAFEAAWSQVMAEPGAM
jgi:RNA polymerase sigma-70 factor (ECF subfamily)